MRILNIKCIYFSNAHNKIDVPPEIQTTLQFLYSFSFHSGLPQETLTEHIPESIFHIVEMIIS